MVSSARMTLLIDYSSLLYRAFHSLPETIPMRGVTTLLVVDEAELQRRYGIPGRAYGDFALLRGDPSDGLPGVPGIGEKTAAALIARHGSLGAVLASRSLSSPIARRIDAAREYLAAASRVVLPVASVPLASPSLALPAAPAKPRLARQLAREHRLDAAVARVEAALGRAGGGLPGQEPGERGRRS